MTVVRSLAGVVVTGSVLVACGGGAATDTAVPVAAPAAVVIPAPVASAEPATPVEPEMEGTEESLAQMGMIGLLNASAGGDPDAPQAPWGTDDEVKGNMWGESIGDSFGAGGLGLSGIGSGGTGTGIGLGTIGSIGHGAGTGTSQGFGVGGGNRPKPPGVKMGTATATGNLPKEVIQRIVRQNFGRFRLCYEQALTKNPALARKVTVKFTIATSGSVVAAAVDSADFEDAAMDACVVRAFATLSFPTPEGGIVVVKYPITFTPGDSAPAGAAAPGPAIGAARTIQGRPLADASISNVESALKKAGWKIVSSSRRNGASGAQTVVDLVAEKDGLKASITFQPAKHGDAALSADEIRRIDAAGASVSDGDFYLGVILTGGTEAKAAAGKLVEALTDR